MRTQILGTEIDNVGMNEAMAIIRKRTEENRSTRIFTPNAIMVYHAMKDPTFRRMLAMGDVNIPDGMGLLLAAKILKRPLSHRLAGIDLGWALLAYAAESGLRVFLLGGRPDVAEAAKKKLTESFPSLTVCGTHHGYFSDESSPKLRQLIEESSADILLVCLGSPRQEMWISEYSPKNVRITAALGGSLDVWAGDLKRAPRFISDIGLEWLWRMCLEPKRFVKFPTLVSFFLAVLCVALRENFSLVPAKLNKS